MNLRLLREGEDNEESVLLCDVLLCCVESDFTIRLRSHAQKENEEQTGSKRWRMMALKGRRTRRKELGGDERKKYINSMRIVLMRRKRSRRKEEKGESKKKRRNVKKEI